jgi:hypothetical protein
MSLSRQTRVRMTEHTPLPRVVRPTVAPAHAHTVALAVVLALCLALTLTLALGRGLLRVLGLRRLGLGLDCLIHRRHSLRSCRGRRLGLRLGRGRVSSGPGCQQRGHESRDGTHEHKVGAQGGTGEAREAAGEAHAGWLLVAEGQTCGRAGEANRHSGCQTEVSLLCLKVRPPSCLPSAFPPARSSPRIMVRGRCGD